MKKKVALLLAVVMVMSLLPMNLFGARPGSMRDPQNSPVWGIASYTFRIDANALSNLALESGQRDTMAVLDFVLEGGANSSEVGFISTSALQFTFSAGPNFRVEGETGANVTDFLTHLRNIANNDANRERINYDVPGSSGWNFRPSVPDNNHPAPTATFFRQLQIDLFGASWIRDFGSFRNEVNELPTLEGWLDVTIAGIRASEADAAMSITLLEGGDRIRPLETVLLESAAMFVGWGTGLNISTVSVVPMSGIAELSGIRIAEAIVGRLLSPNVATTNNGFHVRLVAPRGFRWDTEDLLLPASQQSERGVRATGNVAFGGREDSSEGFDVSLVDPNATNNEWTVPADRPWTAPTTNPFVNANTGRNEIILRVETPARASSFAARTTPAEVTIRGLNLIPVRGAATSGNVAIDVYVGDVLGAPSHWDSVYGTGAETGVDAHGSGAVGILPRTAAQVRVWPAGSYWTERTAEASHWRERSLVVATMDYEGDLEITGPSTVQTVRSGGWSIDTIDLPIEEADQGLDFADDDRWLNGGSHTLRIAEVVQGNMFRTLDRYEIVPPEGVKIVDARVRARTEGATTHPFGWGNFERTANFVPALHDFLDDGSLTFATRVIEPEQNSRLRRLEVGFVLSVEAGFAAANGDEIEMRVYRNGIYAGSAVVANAYDPITVTQPTPAQITRNALDVLALTPVAGFTISESDYGVLDHGYELRFRLQATQNGREVSVPGGAMGLWLGEPTINYDESGFELREIPGNDIIGFEVRRTSNGTPATITFDDVYLAGPTVPGLEWHVIVYGPEISANSDLILGDTDYVGGVHRNGTPLSEYTLRGRFYDMPYDVVVLEVLGLAVIDDGAPGGPVPPAPPQAFARRMFTAATMVNVDGVYIQAVAFPTVAPGIASSMINPRVFADFIGASVEWNEAARTASFTGMDRGGQSQTVVLTLDSPVAMVNGNPVDIATGAGQGALAGNIQPVVIGGRSYVPARFLATIFGVPIEGDGRTVTLG